LSSFTEISNSSKHIHNSFDFQEVSVQEKFKNHDERFGIKESTYHEQMQSFVLDEDNKEDQIFQTVSSEIISSLPRYDEYQDDED
jgi:hypothetical protein